MTAKQCELMTGGSDAEALNWILARGDESRMLHEAYRRSRRAFGLTPAEAQLLYGGRAETRTAKRGGDADGSRD